MAKGRPTLTQDDIDYAMEQARRLKEECEYGVTTWQLSKELGRAPESSRSIMNKFGFRQQTCHLYRIEDVAAVLALYHRRQGDLLEKRKKQLSLLEKRKKELRGRVL